MNETEDLCVRCEYRRKNPVPYEPAICSAPDHQKMLKRRTIHCRYFKEGKK